MAMVFTIVILSPVTLVCNSIITVAAQQFYSVLIEWELAFVCVSKLMCGQLKGFSTFVYLMQM